MLFGTDSFLRLVTASQRSVGLEGRPGWGCVTEKIGKTQVLVEEYISLLPGQQTSRLLTAEAWVTAAGAWPAATLVFHRVTQFSPPHVSKVGGRGGKSRQAEGTVRGACLSPHPTADALWAALVLLLRLLLQYLGSHLAGQMGSAEQVDSEEDKHRCPYLGHSCHSSLFCSAFAYVNILDN